VAPDPVELALILGRIFERLGIRYCVGGSVASSVYGEVRTTLDVDLVAELRPEHIDALLAATRGEFHIVEVSVRRAVRIASSLGPRFSWRHRKTS
jgi:hypothetical protein